MLNIPLIKQVLSMFISINALQFSEHNKEIREFILTPELTGIPEKYKIFTYLNNEGKVRYLQQMVWANIKSNSMSLYSEITFPPYGLVLAIDPKGQLERRYTEMTKFSHFKLEEKLNLNMTMFHLPTYLQIPMDYRTKNEIDNALADSE